MVIWEELKKYFNVFEDREEEAATIESITSGVRFRGAQLWILIFAIFIASLGLNVNSTAVIIGAMLISPLMGPIIGMGLAIGIADLVLFKSAFKNFAMATVISVLTATVYFIISPFGEAQSELLARTSPSLYDVLIAFCGGAAGFIALATKGKGNVIPGVAIATALMPPLCTAGYGIAHGDVLFFLGAIYLFFINTVFISIATFLGVRMMKFRRKRHTNIIRAKMVHRYIAIIAIVTMVPAVLMTINIVHKSFLKKNVDNFIKSECNVNGTQIISDQLNEEKKILKLIAVGKEISDKTINDIEQRLFVYHLAGYRLQIIQGLQSDSLMMLNDRISKIKENSNNSTQTIQIQQSYMSKMETQLSGYTRYDELTPKIRKELRTLYPNLSTLSIAPVLQAKNDTSSIRYTVAIIGLKPLQRLDTKQRESLRKWLQLRVQADSLRLITTNE